MGGKSRIMSNPNYRGPFSGVNISRPELDSSLLNNSIFSGPAISANDIMRQMREAEEHARRAMKNPYASMPIEDEYGRNRMIGMRLHLRDGEKFPFDYLSSHLGDEKVFVFVVQNNTPVILEDDRYLFPSDTLVAQLRLIQK